MSHTGSALVDQLAAAGRQNPTLPTIRSVADAPFDWCRRNVTAAWLMVAVVLGLLQAAYFRDFINPDGIAYLDMGDAYLRGDWLTAIRGHWSPLYAWLIAAVVRVLQPPPSLEFPLVHVVNAGIYLVALGTFTFLLRQIEATLSTPALTSTAAQATRLPAWVWKSLGYAVFLWCTLRYGLLELVTPDLLVSALVYAIGGVVLRVRRRSGWQSSVLLGALLGLGYLAKTPMLLLAPVFVAASVLLIPGRAKRLVHAGLTLSVLALVAIPFVLVLSLAKGRLTAGDSAMLNYLWLVDGVTPYLHWQGGPAGSGQPVHRDQVLLEQPAVYAFDSPFWVTYSAWYAPDYWYEGGTPHFVLSGQVRAILGGLTVYESMAKQLALPLVGTAVLVLMRPRGWSSGFAPALTLIAPSITALCMYSIVIVEERYVGPFVVLLFVALLGLMIQLPLSKWSRTVVTGVAAVMLVSLMLPAGKAASEQGSSVSTDVTRDHLLAPDEQAQVAMGLRAAGLQPGDPVASGGRAIDDAWARLARVRIVAEVGDREGATMLATDADARARVQAALLQTHAAAIVARDWPGLTGDPGWVGIGGTSYFYYLMPSRS
ncbi:MAG: hypothetical protein ACR2IK_09835 [Chloroflexota bacterium]